MFHMIMPEMIALIKKKMMPKFISHQALTEHVDREQTKMKKKSKAINSL